jgi:ADP-ribosyl-[dinitrogen reductase] hydrolase
LSSNGRCFDIGTTVARSLAVYRDSGKAFAGPTEPTTAGNGSLMRLAPVVLFFYPDRNQAIRLAAESSRTTHGAAECLHACELMAELLIRALAGAARSAILAPIQRRTCSTALDSIASMDLLRKSRPEIRGSGYVVHCLEAALWCFSKTNSFRDAVLLAANLGEDADTTAAVCGQLAGAHYGVSGIPEAWLAKLAMCEEITRLADQLREAAA